MRLADSRLYLPRLTRIAGSSTPTLYRARRGKHGKACQVEKARSDTVLPRERGCGKALSSSGLSSFRWKNSRGKGSSNPNRIGISVSRYQSSTTLLQIGLSQQRIVSRVGSEPLQVRAKPERREGNLAGFESFFSP